MEACVMLHAPAALSQGNNWIGGRVDLRTGIDAVAKGKNLIIAPTGNLTPVVQSVDQSL
jgi:hypothetical protein